MEELVQRQQYELAFHLLPSFSEDELNEKRRELEELISESGGLVSRFGEIRKTKLAYPIRKEVFSNFGFMEFFAPKNAVEKIKKTLSLNENFLRHTIIHKEEMKPAKLAKPRLEVKRKEAPSFTNIPEGKEEKEIDKKIEEILEKL